MPSRMNSRVVTSARNEVLEMLKEDHKRVKKAYRDFNKLDSEAEPERCEELVRQVLADLEVHTTLEEELLYPAARNAIREPDLIDEAEVEHESAKALIEQLNGMTLDDDKFAARFTVLCEYVMHHVKEEETELFPQLESARLDWEALATEMRERRAELAPEEAQAEAVGAAVGEADPGSERGATQRKAGKTTGGARARGKAGEATASEPDEAMDSRCN